MEWISVEERLPKDGKKVRVKRFLGMEETIATYGGLWWLGSTTGESGTSAKLGITHWSPIDPEPEPDRWIRVEDRLPAPEIAVIACRQGEWDSYEAVRGMNGWYHCGCLMDPPPTHWQPMPGPPKEPAIPDTFMVKRYEGRRPWGSRANWGVYHAASGWLVWNFVDDWAARGVCSVLNKLWARYKGSTEGHEHDTDTTATNSGTNGSTCCTDGGACRRSV